MKLRQKVKRTAAWMLLLAFAWTACFASAEEIGEALTEQPLQEEQTEDSPDNLPSVEESGEEVPTVPETTAEPIPDEWSDTEPESMPPEEEWEEELPENDSAEDEWSEDAAEPEAPMEGDGAFPLDVRDVIDTQFFAYVQTMVPMGVSFDRDQNDAFFVLDEGSILLADLYTENCVQIWFVTQEGELKTGFVPLDGLLVLPNEIAEQMERAELVETMAGMMPAFFVSGMALIPDEGERDEQDAADPAEPFEETTMQPEEQEPGLSGLLPGDFIKVTPFTRVYSEMDETAEADDLLFDGYYVSDANVRIEAVAQDGQGREWLQVSYLYGAENADGGLMWEETATAWVLEADTLPADGDELTVTDIALDFTPPELYYSDGFALKEGHGSIGNYWPGQTNLYASSGHDREYKQIAKLPGHGTIYATPHYLDGNTVYCLEHTMNSPGVRDYDSVPYEIVDLDGYARTPGYSGIVFRPETMHAIGWVMRHSAPYMVLDRRDSSNYQWSRVAGQFAIREVIKQMEGSQYVRDYWQMDEFYRAKDQAPSVYLDYARWLAAEGIARGNITGRISVSGKSSSYAGGSMSGTVTLTTDADLIRIPLFAGRLTGNSAGSDGEYYYLYSGDTITVTAKGTRLSFTAESMSSPDEEANFLIGVPSSDIQKILIPQNGNPMPMKKIEIAFEIPQGGIRATKTADLTGAVLEGAVFELVQNGQVLDSKTTGKDGTALFENLTPGEYVVREAAAPEGYLVSVEAEQTVTVVSGSTTETGFSNAKSTSKIRIVKTDSVSKGPLAGAEFTITRLSAPPSDHGAGVGDVILVLTTDETGCAETDWLEWGTYRVEETSVPEGYINNHFSAEIEAKENDRTYTLNVENTAVQGQIHVKKIGTAHADRTLSGAEFDLCAAETIYGADGSLMFEADALADTLTTGENGEATTKLLPLGKYYLVETKAPEGYVLNGERVDLTLAYVDADTPVVETEAIVPNAESHAKIRIVKQDSVSKKPLAGAELTITRLSVPQSADGVGIGEVAAVITTDETGCAETDWLEWGVYEVKETKIPKGYVDKHFVQTVSAKENGKTYTVEVENDAVQGQIHVKKVGTDHADRDLPDAAFEVRAAEAIVGYDGSVLFEQDALVDTITTQLNGGVYTKLLPLGKYYLIETEAPEGYVLNSERIDLTLSFEDADTPVVEAEAIVPNAESHAKIRIAKRDSGTKKPLAGVEFTITRLSAPESAQNEGVGEVSAVITTDKTGCAETDWLEWGIYEIKETKVPAGYVDGHFSTEIEAFEDGKTYEIEVENDPVMGKIQVEKTGLQLTGFEESNLLGFAVHKPVFEMKRLAGAEFEVRAAEQIIGPDGTVFFYPNDIADTIVTTDSGADTTKELPLGKYMLVETKAPLGYVLDSTPHEVMLTFADHETPLVQITVEAENDYLPAEIKLRKEKEILKTEKDGENVRQVFEHVPGEGFFFGLFNADPIVYGENELPAETMLDAGVTGEDGRLTFSGKYPHGRYFVREMRAPEGWKINPDDFPVTLDPQTAKDNVIFTELEEAVQDEIICAHVKLTKKDITGEDTISGALIEVRNEKGEVVFRNYTDEQGCIPDIPVIPGRYTFKEILAPSGYELNTAEMTFTVHPDGSVTGDTEIRDDFTRVQIVKLDEHGQPLEGVEFGLFKHTGVQVMTAVSDEQGIVTFEKIPYGRYKIRETKPLPYYYESEIEVELTIAGTFINPEKPIQTITNERRKLHCIKVDTSGQYLAGVEFVLLDAETGEIVETVTSNEHGEFVFTKIAIGDWIIRESQAPAGYSRMEDVLLHVDENWEEPEPIRCVNIPDHYEFLKVDENGRPLQGAKFTIEDEHGVLYEMVSDKDGIVHATDLRPGTYVIREIEAADGYDCTDETIHIIIDDRYVVPDEMRRLVNYPSEEAEEDRAIQTGVEMPWTPTMTFGVLMMLVASVVAVMGRMKK